ncbi:endonuclease/exonuclease/phosphatase family protein [Nocardiopsis coralliicola]
MRALLPLRPLNPLLPHSLQGLHRRLPPPATAGLVRRCAGRPVLRAGAVAAALAAAAAGAAVPAAADGLRIHDVQGTTRVSPYAGHEVEALPGVVTAVQAFGSARGFWFADTEGDGDPRTSEALFVFTGGETPDVAPGDTVDVSGTVEEYRPAEGAQTVTQLSSATWEATGSGAELPDPVLLEQGTVPEEYAPQGDDISGRELEPDRYALDFYAAHEHMDVRIDDAPVVGPTDAYGALWVTTEPEQNRTPSGGTAYNSYDEPNQGRVKVESLIPYEEQPFPEADVGDTLAGTTRGPLSYSGFGGYTVQATELGAHTGGGLEPGRAEPAGAGETAVASYNVENLSDAETPQEDFDRLGAGIADALGAPAIVGLEEVQDDSGPADDGTVSPERTLERLTAAIEAAGGPRYEWRQIDPEDGADGGQPGGNIRNAFLFDPERAEFVDRAGGDATTPVEVVDGADGPQLSASPARIAPGDPAWEETRKPLAAEFRVGGETVFAVTNHFSSKGGDEPLHGVRQPPERTTEPQRLEQAAAVRTFADDLLSADPEARLLVLGDLNDFWFSPTLDTLTADGALHNPMEDLPAEERYNYVFDGNSQSLDAILASSSLTAGSSYEVVRINAEFHDQVSDHDPQVFRFPTGS